MQEVRIKDITVTEDAITAELMDGRTISVPLVWSWRLSEATPKQRANWEIIGDGHGVRWPDIDEDISAEGMLYGIPARRPRGASKLSLKSEGKKTTVNKATHRIANKNSPH
jgi:hypothetical protein